MLHADYVICMEVIMFMVLALDNPIHMQHTLSPAASQLSKYLLLPDQHKMHRDGLVRMLECIKSLFKRCDLAKMPVI